MANETSSSTHLKRDNNVLTLGQAARVTVTNEGVVPTRFTVTTTTTTSTTSPKFSPSHKERPHTATIHGDDEFGMKQRNPRDGSPQTGESEPRRPSGPGSEHHDAIEADLLERASAVGDAGLKYPEGQGAIEVVDGGGELAGYGSTEIVVVFAPLTVGDFRTVKVCWISNRAACRGSSMVAELPVEVPGVPFKSRGVARAAKGHSKKNEMSNI